MPMPAPLVLRARSDQEGIYWRLRVSAADLRSLFVAGHTPSNVSVKVLA